MPEFFICFSCLAPLLLVFFSTFETKLFFFLTEIFLTIWKNWFHDTFDRVRTNLSNSPSDRVGLRLDWSIIIKSNNGVIFFFKFVYLKIPTINRANIKSERTLDLFTHLIVQFARLKSNQTTCHVDKLRF